MTPEETKEPFEEMSVFFNNVASGYDDHMLSVGLGESFYNIIADYFDAPVTRLLDLGCGTGLQLEGLFEKFPDIEITGIDMSADMLKLLEEKYPDKKINVICGSYFDVDFGGIYPSVLSTYSLHHFSEKDKLALYEKIYAALDDGGLFVFGDEIVATLERQQELLDENDKKRREHNVPDGEFYHFDTPFTTETEIKLMKAAGFKSAEVVWQQYRTDVDGTGIIIARK